MGNLVQLVRGGPIYTVIWCSYSLVKALDGLRYREAVYRLDDGHWDCYYADELTSVGRWHDK